MIKPETETVIRQLVKDIEDATDANVEFDIYEPDDGSSATITLFAEREIGNKLFKVDYHFTEVMLYAFWDIEVAQACIIGDVVYRLRNAVSENRGNKPNGR